MENLKRTSEQASLDLLNDYRKKLEKAMESTQDNLSQVSLEWVQLWNIVEQKLNKKKGQSSREPAPVNSTGLISSLENFASINVQPIDITMKTKKQQLDSEEEFDSD